MQLSSSLHDLKTLSEQNSGEDDDLESDRSYGDAKPFHALQREGATSSFSKDKSYPTIPTTRKKWLWATVGIIALLLLFSLILLCSGFYSTFLSHEASEHYVILDCGSTGTRVYVYKWTFDQNKGHRNLPIALKSLPEGPQRNPRTQSGRAYHRMETEPGFDKLVHDKYGLRAVLQPLLLWAEKQIPKHAHKDTSLFLYATAGVRRLPKSDSDWLLDKAWTILKKSSFLCRRDWIKLISGMEEAYYGWIALNHHMGLLGSLPAGKTYGSLDLGGSSLQVTFETETPIHADTSISLRIASANHHLSAYSLSGYGLNDAFDKSVAHLFRKFVGTEAGLNNKLQLKHPCLNNGYRDKYACSRCASVKQEGSPLTGGKTMSKKKTGIVVELIGAPQWEECRSLARLTVNRSAWSNFSSGIDCELKPCALSDGLPQPRGKFYAMSGFYVVFRFFNLSSEASLEDVLIMGQKFCGKTWKVAKNSVAAQPFIEQYCFRAPYVASLLRDGLHIKDNQVIIGSGSITWTLGVALLEAGQALSKRVEVKGYEIIYRDIHPAIFVVIFFVSVLLLCCALSCVSNWMPRFLRRSCILLFRYKSLTNSVLNIPSPFRFQRRSPIISGDGRVKTPLSPTISGSQQHPFNMGQGLGGSSVHLSDSSVLPLVVSHSYSSGSLGQMQFGSGAGSFWPPHRGKTTLSSRRSQSREDLSSSLADAHVVKV
ncbi:probable apyrase 7 isoform X1 [Musa acuminata AAA Group]|uniref:probable apyrase 7 isoform X1 n=1 Tax=Musa acuminata AAA Group TaxID=214697 RepID=UPI0031DF3328